MAIDRARLKSNLAKLRGETPKNEKRKSVFWRPAIGEHKVYLLPWSKDDDYPFKEKWFYFALGKGKDPKTGFFRKPPLTLKQYGEPDPVQEMIDRCWNSEDNADKELAKKLFSNQTAYLPVIVQGEEELGVRLWPFSSKTVYERMTHLFSEEKYGDLNDPANERWINITVVEEPTKKPPMNKKTNPPDVEFENEPLSEDPEQIKKWLADIPDLDEALRWNKKTADELKELLQVWADSTPEEEGSDGDGTEHTSKAKASTKPKAKKKKKQSKATSKEEAMAMLNEFAEEEEEDEDDDE